MAWLEYLGKRVELTSGMVLGRSRKCDLHVDDPRASRQHCRLEYDGRHWWVVDLGASNATRRNKQLIDGRMVLNHSDVITIGGSDITFQQPEAITDTNADSPSQAAEPEYEEEFDATFLAPAPMAAASSNPEPQAQGTMASATAHVQAPPQAADPNQQATPANPQPISQPLTPVPEAKKTAAVWPPPPSNAVAPAQPRGEGKGLKITIIVLVILACILATLAAVLHFAPDLIV